jgi:hypothetical protein
MLILGAWAGLVHAEVAPVTNKPLKAYPLSDRMWLGTFGGEVEVNPKVDLPAIRAGEIEWKFNEGAAVTEGSAVAWAGAEQIRQSANQRVLDASALVVKLKTAKWTHDEKTAGLERQVEEMKGRMAKLSLTPKERELLGPDLAKRLIKERQKLEEQLAGLREKLAPEFRAEELRIEQEQLRQDDQRAQVEHLGLVQTSEVIAPQDGIVHILKTGMVRANDIVGTIESRGKAKVTLQVLDPEVRSEPPDSLAIDVSGPRGEMIPGSFSTIERMPSNRFGPAVYKFTLDAGQNAPLTDELTGERMVTLYKKLGRQARMVTKADFLFSHADEIHKLGWAGFFLQIWPNARIFHVGPRSVALIENE